MEEDKLLSDVVDKFTDKPTKVTVTVHPKSRFQKLLMKLRILPKQYEFELRPITVGNMYRISAKIIEMPEDLLQPGMLKALITGSFEHMSKLIYVVGVGIQNNRFEPKKSLLTFIENEFTAKGIATVLEAVMHQMNVQAFIRSIVLIKGANILDKMSPMEEGELIAPQD